MLHTTGRKQGRRVIGQADHYPFIAGDGRDAVGIAPTVLQERKEVSGVAIGIAARTAASVW